jgi:spermidine synthase
MNMFTQIYDYFIPKHYTFQSETSGKLDIYKLYGQVSLSMNGIPQSGPYYASMWNNVLPKLPKNPQSCLILGLGGGTIIPMLQKKYLTIDITTIEIDPIIIQIAKDFFLITENSNLHIIQDDAFRWIKKSDPKLFDVIIIDVFHNIENPPQFHSTDFFISIASRLSKNGIAIVNAYINSKIMDQKITSIFSKYFSTVKTFINYPTHRVYLLKK